MTAIAINGPRGLAPRWDPTLLNANQATVATETDLASGAIQPWSDLGNPQTDDTSLAKAGVIRSIWLYRDSFWFHWADDADAAMGPVAGDDYDLAYFTVADDQTPPQMTVKSKATGGTTGTYPEVSYDLGIPSPNSPPGVVSNADCDDAVKVPTVYVYTYVSAYGEEGPPSPVSDRTTRCPGDEVGLYDLELGAYGAHNLASKRIYRAATGATSTEYLFVDEIPLAHDTYTDRDLDAELGEPIPSTLWEAPPSSMLGLTILPNGIVAGFEGRDLYLSEPYRPHAWPRAYRQAMTDPIVGLGAFGSSLVVCTTGKPVLMQGSTPASMSGANLGVRQSCVSKRGIQSLPGVGVVYPSPDGLVMVNGNGAQVLTDGLLTRSDWQAYNPASITGALYEGRYIGFYDTGEVKGGIILDPSDSESGLTETDLHATAAYNDLRNDALYLVTDDGQLKVWNAGSGTRPYTWRSKPFVVDTLPNFGAAKVTARSYDNLTMKVYADGVLRHTKTVTSGMAFRLPSGFRARKWEIELVGIDPVTKAVIGESMEEVAHG